MLPLDLLQQIRFKAAADARNIFDAPKDDPVDQLSSALKSTMSDIKPYWLHSTKRDPNDTPVHWGPDTNLHAGGAGDRMSNFSTVMNGAFGGG